MPKRGITGHQQGNSISKYRKGNTKDFIWQSAHNIHLDHEVHSLLLLPKSKRRKKENSSDSGKAVRIIELCKVSYLCRRCSYSKREDWKATSHITSKLGLQSRMSLGRKINVYRTQKATQQLACHRTEDPGMMMPSEATPNTNMASHTHACMELNSNLPSPFPENIMQGSRNPGRLGGIQD